MGLLLALNEAGYEGPLLVERQQDLAAQVRQLIIDGVKEIVTNYEVDGIHFDDYFYPNLDDSKAETWFDYPEYQAGGTSLSVAEW